MLLDVLSSFIEAIGNLVSTIGLGWVSVISLILLLLTVVISFVCVQHSIEVKTLKAVNRINKYLEKNPFVNEENLVEFNKLMKHIPAPMRREWQEYMVSRDKKPSDFLTEYNSIDRPFKSSAYASHIIAVRASIISIALLSALFCASYFVADSTTNGELTFLNIIASLLPAIVVLILGEIYIMFLKARKNSLVSDVYFNYPTLQRYLDRAVTTLPDYIDYEILFTRKEITSGIPVLQEYLQQRAAYEEEQIRKARDSQVSHEKYDFSSLGINGSLVMEKAMQVSEQFIGNKSGIRADIAELESQKDLLEKNYDEKVKTTQRKLRDIQETLDRLKEKLDATTNLIVGNDLRKQRENEIQKQRQIEKEAMEDGRKFEAEQKNLQEQIDAKRAEIEEDRKRAETNLNSEFKSYADKIYTELRIIVDEQVKNEVAGMHEDIAKLQQELEDRERVLVEKNTICNERQEQIEQYQGAVEEYASQLAEKDNLLQEKDAKIAEQEQKLAELGSGEDIHSKEVFEVKKQLESRNLEISKKDELLENQKRYIAELKSKKGFSGDIIFVDEESRLYYYDGGGNVVYVNQDLNGMTEQQSSYDEIEPEEPQAVEEVEQSNDEIEEIDKMIEEQNEQLDKHSEELKKQLEDTQKVAEEVKKESKKSSSKKAPQKKNSKSSALKKQKKSSNDSDGEDADGDLDLEAFNAQLKGKGGKK